MKSMYVRVLAAASVPSGLQITPCRIWLVAIVIFLLLGRSGQAELIGVPVLVDVQNLPGDGDGEVIIGEGPQPVGSSGLIVDPNVIPISSDADVLQFSLSAERGTSLASDTNSPSAFFLFGLEPYDPVFGDPPPLQIHEDSLFVYFTVNGVPQPLRDAFQLGLTIGPDPLGRGFDALFPGNAAGRADPDTNELNYVVATYLLDADKLPQLGLGGGAPSPPFPPGVGILDLVGLGDVEQQIDGLHFGFQLSSVPEPDTLGTLALLLGSLALSRRRASRKASRRERNVRVR